MEVVIDNREETTMTTTQSPEDGLSIDLEFSPSHVVMGESTVLRCKFRRTPGQKLDSLKWYKDGQEFFRVVTGPVSQEANEFAAHGVNIDQDQLALREDEGDHVLLLSHTELSTTGTYRCQITEAQAPFRSVQQEKNLIIVDIKLGDRVRICDSVGTPRHGWGDVDHTSIGTVSVLPSEGEQTLLVDFPEQSAWSGLLSEVEVVHNEESGTRSNLK